MKKLFKLSLVVLISLMFAGEMMAQLNESFTSATFPPTGWTRITYLGTGGAWARSTSSFNTTPACALSNFGSLSGSENYLKTPQFTPITNDSLIFFFRQSFTAVYTDTFSVLVSVTDTAKASFVPKLTLIDGVNYPTAGTYGRFAISLSAYAGTPIYIAFRHRDNDGDAVRIDDISTLSPPAVPNDMGVSAATVGVTGQVFSAGKGYNMTVTAKNFGSATQNAVPVYYKLNGGTPVGPVNTVGPIVTNATENVVFSGGNAVIFSPGANVIKVFTSLAGDGNALNDTLTLNFTILNKISTYPYVENFTLATGWTTIGTAAWGIGSCVNPNGTAADNAAIANFYSITAGNIMTLRSPELDFTGISNPVLDFYVAYKTYTNFVQDSLEVLVSTNGGINFFSASTVYNKADSTNPSLSTLPAAAPSYTPAAATEWRHETVSLLNVANSGNVVIGFRAKSRFGNNCWVDNVIVSNPNSFCTSAVTGTGTYSCNPLVSLNFTATPLPPNVIGSNDNVVSGSKISGKEETAYGNIPSVAGDVKVVSSNEQNDNPSGGTAFVTQFTNNDPGQNIAANSGQTTGDGSMFTPSVVYHDYWFNITYNGNDKTGYATYDITIDLDGLVFIDPLKLYIMKRADVTGAWVCQNTTVVGNALRVTGLTDFSDFGIGGVEALPVELSSFVSTINGNNVTLNWSTASEINNSGFDVERSSNNVWTKVGNVSGHGTSTTPNSYSFTDRNVASGNYSYRLKQVDYNGNFEYFNLSNEVIVGIPVKYDLSQNYPNPFNPSTKINYALPTDGLVSIKIFDMSGKEVMSLVNEVKTAGYYSVSFNASNLSSGIYFYSLKAADFTATKKMMLVK
ncbi:MAG: choice-of-anchor J domain-containing protein [Bacteroidetes bacterium]|nr:choice-of-anchor J domain-containing protein [Bacteroidota bacterium]